MQQRFKLRQEAGRKRCKVALLSETVEPGSYEHVVGYTIDEGQYRLCRMRDYSVQMGQSQQQRSLTQSQRIQLGRVQSPAPLTASRNSLKRAAQQEKLG